MKSNNIKIEKIYKCECCKSAIKWTGKGDWEEMAKAFERRHNHDSKERQRRLD